MFNTEVRFINCAACHKMRLLLQRIFPRKTLNFRILYCSNSNFYIASELKNFKYSGFQACLRKMAFNQVVVGLWCGHTISCIRIILRFGRLWQKIHHIYSFNFCFSAVHGNYLVTASFDSTAKVSYLIELFSNYAPLLT